MFKKIISVIALAFLCSCSFGQNKNIAATRAYCDHNRTIAAQDAVTQLKPALEDYIVDEVDRVSRSFVTNAYPVPIPITNTIYQITDNVISNRTIYETTNVLVYSQYSFITNQYFNTYNITNIINTIENVYTNFYTTNNITTNIFANVIEITTNIINDYTTTTNIFNYFSETNYVDVITSNITDITVTNLDLLAIYYPDNDVTNISQFLDARDYAIEILNDSTASITVDKYYLTTIGPSIVLPYFVTKDNNRYIVSQVNFNANELSSIKSIISPITVKTILGNCYATNLSYISFPGITNIDVNIRASKLKDIYLPSVLRVGDSVFRDNNYLKSVTLPNAIEIGEYAFFSCTNLSNITIPNVNRIGSYGFSECNPSYVSLPFVIEIGEGGFYNCNSLKNISLPSVRKLGDSAFRSCESLESLTLLHSDDIYLSTNSFYDCSSLRRLKLPSVTDIAYHAFTYCRNLEYIYIPNVTNIEVFAFQYCINLKYIDFGPNPLLNVPVLTGILGDSDPSMQVLVPKGMKSSFIAIPAWNNIASKIVEY